MTSRKPSTIRQMAKRVAGRKAVTRTTTAAGGSLRHKRAATSKQSAMIGKAKNAPSSVGQTPTSSEAAASYGVRPTSKLGIIIAQLQQKGGTTIEAMCVATGWQSHSVRGALSGTIKKKLGLDVQSETTDGIRHYRIVD